MYQGITAETSRVQLTKTLGFLLFCIASPYIIIFQFSGKPLLGWFVVPIVLSFLLSTWCVKKGWYTVAKFLLIIPANLGAGFYAASFGKESGIQFLYFAFIGFSVVIFQPKEKIKIGITALITVFCFLALEITNYHIVTVIPTSHAYKQILYWTAVGAVLLMIFLYIQFYAILNQKAENQLILKNNELETAYKTLQEETKRSQQAVHTAQDLSHRAALSTLTLGIAYEIRNPMGVLQGHLMLLADEFGGKRNETYNVDDETFNNQWGYHLTPEDFITDQQDREGARAVFLYLQEKGYLTADGQLGEMFDNYNFAFPDLDLASHLESNRSRIVGRLRTAHHFSALYYFFNVSMLQFQRILKSVDGMLKYGISGKESGQALKKIDVSQVLNDCVSVLSGTAKRKGIVFQYEMPKSLPLIFGDDLRLHQAFFNMMFNSVQALEDLDAAKKSICIKIKPVSFKSLSGTVQKGLEVRLCDNGPGISNENLSKIFHPFFSTKSPTGGKNAGLGLSLVKEVILAHEGTVRVCSILNKGTLFKVRLPGTLV